MLDACSSYDDNDGKKCTFAKEGECVMKDSKCTKVTCDSKTGSAGDIT